MATFAEEFKKQRAMKGSGKTFEYKGKTYSTDTADGKKAGPAKPAARPANLNPQSGASRSTADKVKPKGLGSRIMDASASVGEFLGKKAADIANYGKDKPKPRVGTTTNYKSGGVIKMKEGSAKDMREDKAMAKKAGMTMKQHEASAADKKHDAPKKMASGGMVRGAGCATRGKTGAKEY